MIKPTSPKGNENREAIASLGGYAYQIYQAAIAWIELDIKEFLFLEVAEDYVVAAKNALKAVQVKRTKSKVTINSDDIVTTIDSYVELHLKQPQLEVRLHHVTTSEIGMEKKASDRIDKTATLIAWRNLARTGDLSRLRTILANSKLSQQTKDFIGNLDDTDFREKFLRRIHFDCGALDFKFLKQQLKSTVIKLLQERSGVASQADGCVNDILMVLLHKSIQQDDRFVDRAVLEDLLEKATSVSMNRAQVDAHNALMAEALASTLPKTADLVSNRLALPRPIDEVPLPVAIAPRHGQIEKIVLALETDGFGWVLGAAGVGKTVAAKLAARQEGGNWASINLRNLSSDQVSGFLNDIQRELVNERGIHGLLIDDFECLLEPHVVENFLSLLAACRRRDILLIVTAPRPPSSDLLFASGLRAAVEIRLAEFTEADVEQILNLLGITDKRWANYTYLISGGGHPQLVTAAIQSMQRSGWNTTEFRTLNSLMDGNPEIEQVRIQTRQRLLKDLPDGSRRLLERISLTTGGFKRALVLDLAQVAPVIDDGGILFENLVGSWIDQQEKDRFSLSPLLSNFAATSLSDKQKEQINFEIANSLAAGGKLDPITANSALMAAWIGKNEGVLVKLCMSVLSSNNTNLEMIAPHLLLFTHMSTDIFAYDDNPAVSQIFRGSQLLLKCYEQNGAKEFEAALEAFKNETKRVQPEKLQSGMELLIYSKLMLSTPIFGPVPLFLSILQRLNFLFENQDSSLPEEFFEAAPEIKNIDSNISFMFLNQARQIKKIGDLLSIFEELDSCAAEFRAKVFKNYDVPEIPVDIDMLVSGAWLEEHEANTIEPEFHSSTYEKMEILANKWKRLDLAVACCKYQAVILDEYGNDKDAALQIIDEGLKRYGRTNSELIRAKAKILYRANDHQASLELSSILIEGDAPLSETERAFLGREAAISAEKQGDFNLARRYYLFGAIAAEACNGLGLMPMHIGLLADAALASWHTGDREICLIEMGVVLEKLAALDSETSLSAAHCHAIVRHALLWLDQDATGEVHSIANGEIPKIYPGLVSNPEPHPDIGKRFLPPLEISWYMLSHIENYCLLDLGITRNIGNHLPKGPVREGRFLLTKGKRYKAFCARDYDLFLQALGETVAEFAFVASQGSYVKSFNIENVTYADFPSPTQEQIDGQMNLAECQILSFAASCILSGDAESYDALVAAMSSPKGYSRRNELVDCLTGEEVGTEYNLRYASLLFAIRKSIDDSSLLSPITVLELALKVLQTAKRVDQIRHLSEQTLDWLKGQWDTIWEKQRFLLNQPSFFEAKIVAAWGENEDNTVVKLLTILIAILPTLGISNQNEVKVLCEELLRDLAK